MNVSKSIQISLINKGMSKGALAKAMEVGAPTVSRWCSGGQCPMYVIQKMAKLFDIQVSEFIALGE
mgnify:CR=1 FL=1|tara:strand:- start:476 stop:673 length:198 start_codon:yes stop_codon:yes gene_type:complete